ncbi:SpoIIE family protein phosphatase [Streptomyces sp. NBC_01537]|uniref:PP2C family protein-serine/threonine phosphatase n=1 Tax=Streptomyces sp. NBC_01537 TaxID=2903896 RepID=UPI0038685BD5
MAERLANPSRLQEQWQGLLDAVLAISRELDPDVVLHRIATTAIELVDARYGALAVLDEDGVRLSDFVFVGLSEGQQARMDQCPLPSGKGLLGQLLRRPGPLRIADVPTHPGHSGFPPGHPRMHSLLGVAITVRGRVYGNLYLTNKRGGRPFDTDDEAVVVALAGAAGVAIENARLYQRVQRNAEQFQRLLLPQLPDLRPFTAAAVYRPAVAPAHLGGDWYDALLLPDGACAAIIGDVIGHDLYAAAAMAQIRNMLRALAYDRCTPPSAILTQLDRTLLAITEGAMTTACLARIEPPGPDCRHWMLRWSTAGHLPPLLLLPDGATRYLYADPGIPLGVDAGRPRPDHTHSLAPATTVILFTDGLVEQPGHPLDAGLHTIAAVASANAGQPLDRLCRTLADNHPSDGHDDMALLTLQFPAIAT